MVGVQKAAQKRQKETVMYTRKDIVLAVDYHDQNLVVRWFNCQTAEERLLKYPTTEQAIGKLVDESVGQAAEMDGRVLWIMESTTGWARVKKLLGSKVHLIVANVLQMPLPPKAYRRKTDKIDTGRILREFLNGSLPVAFQPSVQLRQIRRMVTTRESLVSRRTAVRNWIGRYLAHETWESRNGLWSAKGIRLLEHLAAKADGPDRVVLSLKLAELESLAAMTKQIETEILRIYKNWPDAQRVDEIYGIGPISAVSICARIGPAERFSGPEQLISFAGLAPGVHESDQTRRMGRIGGGGTDKHLRHYIIEATIWARRIPRYRPTYERVERKRGAKIARLVVGRLLLRSIYKMLSDDVRFNRLPAA
jgi:transposase